MLKLCLNWFCLIQYLSLDMTVIWKLKIDIIFNLIKRCLIYSNILPSWPSSYIYQYPVKSHVWGEMLLKEYLNGSNISVTWLEHCGYGILNNHLSLIILNYLVALGGKLCGYYTSENIVPSWKFDGLINKWYMFYFGNDWYIWSTYMQI